MTITTTVPITVEVCQDTFSFVVNVTNTTINTADNVVVRPQMPTGISFAAIPSGGIGTLSSLPTPNDPSISIGSILPGATVQLIYKATAGCGIVNFIQQSNPGSSSGLVKNLTEADFEIGGIPLTAEEINGSESYNIIYPDINVSYNTNQSFNEGLPGETYNRTYQIQNGGLGKLSSLTIDIVHGTGIEIVGTNTGTLVLGATGASITLGPADFALIGNNDGFLDAEETISITDTVLVETCDANQSDYNISWGCSIDQCQNVTIAAGTISDGGAPDVNQTMVTNIPTFYNCSDTGVFAMQYINNGTTNLDAARNFVLREIHDVGLYSFFELTINGVDVNALNPVITNVNTTFSQNRYSFDNLPSLATNLYGPGGPDGPGGFEDLDDDGFFDDLGIGDTLIIEARYLLTDIHAGQCPVAERDRILDFALWYDNYCDDPFNTPQFRVQVEFFTNGAAITDGESNLVDTQVENYSFLQPFRIRNSVANRQALCDSLRVTTFVVLPTGIVPNGTVAYVDGLPVAFTQSNDTLFIDGGEYALNTNYESIFSIDLMLDCSLTNTGSTILEWGEQVSCGCGSPVRMGCATQEILKHCLGSGGSGVCLTTTGFDVERTSLGFTDASMTTKVARSDSGIVLNRAYECDTICASATSVLSGGTTNNAIVRIEYGGAGASLDNLLTFSSAIVEIVDVSTGTVFNASVTPIITYDVMDQKYFVEFNVDDLIQNQLPGAVISSGDSVNLKAIFTVTKSEELPLGIFELPQFRATHSTEISGTLTSCDIWSARLNILKASLSHVSNFNDAVTNRVLGTIGSCGNGSYGVTSIIIGGLGVNDDFPNEFRPFINWADEAIFELPDVVNYTSGARIVYNGNNVIIPNEVEVDNVVTVTTINPVLERHQQIKRVAYVRGTLKCNSSPNTFVNDTFYVSTNYTKNAYSEDAACQEIVVLDSLDYRFTIASPVHTVTASPALQDGFESEISWNVQVCVGRRFGNNLSFVYVENPSGNMNIEHIIHDNGTTLDTLEIFSTAGGTLANLVSLVPEYGCANLIVVASNTNCQEGVLDSLKVMAGYTCSVDSVFDSSMCAQDTATLFLNPQVAGLQATYTSSDSTDLCTPISYEFIGTSTRPANMDNLKFYTTLPNGLSLLSGATVEYPLGSSPQVLPTATDIFGTGTLGWDLSLVVGLENGLIGTRDTTINEFILSFDVELFCDFDPANPALFNLSGTTNCGELIEVKTQDNININGFTDLDQLTILATATDFSCTNDATVEIKLTNDGTLPTSNNGFLNVRIPSGTAYVSSSALTAPTEEVQLDGSTLLEWPLSTGLIAGANETLSFGLNRSDSICNDQLELEMTSIIRLGVFCADSAASCELTGTTSETDTLRINVLPPSVDFSFVNNGAGNDSICSMSPLLFVSNDTCATNIHFWSFGDGGTSTLASPNYTFATIGVHNVQHIVYNDCFSDTLVKAINVVLCDTCSADASFTTSTLCMNDSLLFTSNDSTGIHIWDFGYFGANSSSADPIFVYGTVGTYSVTHIVESDCGAIDTVIQDVTIVEPDKAAIILTGTNPFCEGDSILLSVDGVFSAYMWSTGATTPSIWVTTTGTYGGIVVDSNGCSTVCNAVTVTSLSSITLNINDVIACSPTDNTVLDAGSGFDSYLWSTGETTQTINATGTGQYFVTVTQAGSCEGTDTLNVFLNTNSINISDTTICAGDSVSVSTGVNGLSYLWSTGETTSNITINMSGNYTVTVVDSNNCILTDSFNVTVIDSVGADFTFNGGCRGSEITFTPLIISNGITHQWLVNGFTSTDDILLFTFNTSGVFTVKHIITASCFTDTITKIITINESPKAAIVLTGTNPFCAGDSILLSIDGVFSSYMWSTGEVTPSIWVTEAGTYGAIVSDSTGCSTTCNSVAVSSYPALVFALTDTSICIGENAILNAFDVNAMTYLWSTGENTSAITVNTTGTYSVEVKSNDDCVVNDSSIVIVNAPTVAASSNISRTGQGCLFILSTTDVIGYSYAWFSESVSPNNLIGTTASVTHSENQNGNRTYIVVVTDEFGCTVTETVTVIVSGLDCRTAFVSPNPFTNNFTLVNDFPVSDNARVVIINLLGQPVFEDELNGSTNDKLINTSNLDRGVYYLQIIDGYEILETIKLVKQ